MPLRSIHGKTYSQKVSALQLGSDGYFKNSYYRLTPTADSLKAGILYRLRQSFYQFLLIITPPKKFVNTFLKIKYIIYLLFGFIMLYYLGDNFMKVNL